jgi:hypothetical protein
MTVSRYLHALEERCHAIEAVVGILLSIPDQRAISLLSELSEDPFVRNVFEIVNNSSFGLRGRRPNVTDFDSPMHHGSSELCRLLLLNASEIILRDYEQILSLQDQLMSGKRL